MESTTVVKLNEKQLRKIVESVIAEAGPDEMSVDSSILDSEIVEATNDIGVEMAQSLVSKFTKKMMLFITQTMNVHAMSHKSDLKPNQLMDFIVEFDEEEYTESFQECVTDIVDALEKHAKLVGNIAQNVVADQFG